MKIGFCALVLFALPLIGADDIVNNGRVPTGGTYTLAFSEDLRFGGTEEEDAFLWGSINTDLAVDKNGHMFVGDPQSNEIHEFDKDGKLVRKVAGPGPGPGELQATNLIQILADNRLAVFESKPMFMPRFQFFGGDRAYLEMKSPASMTTVPISAHFDPAGGFIAGAIMLMDIEGGGLTTKTGVISLADFSVVKEYSEYKQSVDYQAMNTPSGLADMVGGMLKGFYAESGVFTYDNAGNFYAALTNKYEIVKWSPGVEKKLMTIRRDYKPLINTAEEKTAVADNLADNFRETPLGPMINDEFVKRVIEIADLPLAKNPIEAMGVTPEGYLLVIHDNRYDKGVQTADIFDKKGAYKGQVSLDNWAFLSRGGNFKMVFRNGFAYTIENDSEDENQLVRYTYKLVKR